MKTEYHGSVRCYACDRPDRPGYRVYTERSYAQKGEKPVKSQFCFMAICLDCLEPLTHILKKTRGGK